MSVLEQFIDAVERERVAFSVDVVANPGVGMTLECATFYVRGLDKSLELLRQLQDDAEGKARPQRIVAANPYGIDP